jgi:hypothetical protein
VSFGPERGVALGGGSLSKLTYRLLRQLCWRRIQLSGLRGRPGEQFDRLTTSLTVAGRKRDIGSVDCRWCS